jgi:trk system potassium uptake protein TrkA
VRTIYIVISGGGKVGSSLAGTLSGKGYTVTVIERNPAICERLSLSAGIMVINGDACDFRYQEEAKVERADVFAAVTGEDDDNLVACQLARTHFDVPRTVARVNNPKNERIFNLMGIDAISSTSIIAQLIEEETDVGGIITLHTLKKGKFAIVEVDIPGTASNSRNVPIKDLDLPRECVLVSIVRGDDVIIPRGGDMLRTGDSVIAVTSLEKEESLKRILTS